MGLAGSHLGFKAGSHVGGSKIPVGIPGGIGGIPPDFFTWVYISSKNMLKTLTANFMNNFHVGNVCFPYKALE